MYSSAPRSTLFPYTTLFRSRAINRVHMVRDQSQRSGVSSLCARDYFRSAECPFVLGPMYHLRKDGPWLSLLPNKHDEHFGRRSEEHTSELQSRQYLVCRLLL